MSRLSFILEDGDSLEMDSATEEVSVDETASEVVDAGAEVSEDMADTAELAEVTETLEGLYATAQLFHTEGFNKTAVALLAGQLDSIERRTGGAISIPAIADYSSESAGNESLVLVMEGIKDSIKKAWAAFVLMLKKVWASITTFFNKLFISASKIKSRADELVNKMKSGDWKDSAPEEEISGDYKWLLLDKNFDPHAAVKMGVTVYDKVLTKVKEGGKKFTTLFNKLIQDPSDDTVIKEIDGAFAKTNETTFFKNSHNFSHTTVNSNGVLSYKLVDVKVKGKQPCLSKNDTIELAQGVSTLANSLIKKKDAIKALNDTIKAEIVAIEKAAKETKDDDNISKAKVIGALEKASGKKDAASLNNTANLVFRVALSGLRYAEACAKKLEGKKAA